MSDDVEAIAVEVALANKLGFDKMSKFTRDLSYVAVEAYRKKNDEVVKYIKAANDSRNGWLPISTAQKKELYVLVRVPNRRLPQITTYSPAHGEWIVDGNEQPTHWQPIPAPPKD